MQERISLRGTNDVLFNLFTSCISASTPISTPDIDLLELNSNCYPEIEEPSFIDQCEDSSFCLDKSQEPYSISKTETSFSDYTPTNDFSFQQSDYNRFSCISYKDIESICNEETTNHSIQSPSFDEEENTALIQDLNNTLSKRLLRECFDLPEVLYACFQQCIFNAYYEGQTNAPILCADYKQYYQESMLNQSRETILFDLLSQNESYITHDALVFFLSSFISFSPSLEFLLDDSSLYTMYITTVAYIIEFRLADGRSKITRSQFTASDFPQMLTQISSSLYELSSDPYFSYEATCVLWSLFNGLDTNKDLMLTMEDFKRYEDMALTELALSLLFTRRGQYSSELGENAIDYREFVNLMIANESRRCKESVTYWFSIIDLNLNGLIDESCIYCFYKSQKERLNEVGLEGPSFEQYLATIRDLIYSKKTAYTIHDFIPAEADLQLTVINKTVAIELLVNVLSLIKYEHHDPLRGADIEYSNQRYGDWQIFVSTCYEQISMREEENEEF